MPRTPARPPAPRARRGVQTAAVVAALAATTLLAASLLAPPAAWAQLASQPDVARGTDYLTTQGSAIFNFVRWIAFFGALGLGLIKGVKAVNGDGGSWKGVVSAFVVAFIAYNPGFVMVSLLGLNANPIPTLGTLILR